jgi:hypothetical protein
VTQWFKRIGRAVAIGVAWAVVWAPIAVVIGTTIIDPDNSMDEMWPAIGAYPGFLCGVIFVALVGIAERGRKLDQLSLARAAGWAGLAGVVVGVFPFTVGTPTSSVPFWQLALSVIGSFGVMSALSAIGSVLIARIGKKRQLRDARAHMA